MSAKRYTDEEKARFLEEFAECGGSAAAFCRARELPYQPFLSWQRRQGAAAEGARKPAAEFVAFEFGGKARAEEVVGPRVELELGGEIVLRIHLPIRRS